MKENGLAYMRILAQFPSKIKDLYLRFLPIYFLAAEKN